MLFSFYKHHTRKKMIDKQRAEKAVRELLFAIGEDPDRAGLKETPKRVAKMYEELFSGLHAEENNVLKFFDEKCGNQIVTIKDIHFYSMCEHHLLPFYGVVHISYMPTKGKLLGLSKLARVVELFAKKPQLQEKMCEEIADFLETKAEAEGVCVWIEAEHMCMTMRGIKKPGAKTITSVLKGKMKSHEFIRREVLDIICK